MCPPANLTPAPPKTWIFIKQPHFSRCQGMLLVDPLSEPAVEIFAEEQAVIVLVELPSIEEQDIELQINGDVLTIATRPSQKHDRRYYREILLPFLVSAERIKQSFRNGVLELELDPTPSREVPRRSQP